MSEHGSKGILTSSEAKILFFITSNPDQTSCVMMENLNFPLSDIVQALTKLVKLGLINYKEDKRTIPLIIKQYSATPLGVCELIANTLLEYLQEVSKKESYNLVYQWYFHNCIEPNHRIFPKIMSFYNNFNGGSLKRTFLNEIASAAKCLADDWEYSVKNTKNYKSSYSKQQSITEEDLIHYLAIRLAVSYVSLMVTEVEMHELKYIFNQIHNKAQPGIDWYDTPLRRKLAVLENLINN